MKIYTFFICFNCINVEARNYILRVPKSMPDKNLTSEFIRSLVEPLKNMPGSVNNSLQIEFRRPMQLIHQKKAAAIRTRYNEAPRNEVQRIYYKYMQPINVLKEQFPNDIIEVQLEIEESNQNEDMVFPKPYKIIKVHKQPVLRTVTAAIKIASQSATNVTLKEVRQAVSQTTLVTQAATQSQVLTDTQNATKRPVYKEDLVKAFSDFELKLSSTISAKSGTNIISPKLIKLRQSLQPEEPYNIQNIVELLKKGIHVQPHATNPTDSNLDWIQIKIPKQ